MKIAANIYKFPVLCHNEDFSLASKSEGKVSSNSGSRGSPQSPQNAEVTAVIAAAAAKGSSWGKKKGAKGKAKNLSKKVPKSHTPTVQPTPGPMRYISDCAKVKSKEWTLAKLKAAYPSEAMSYKKRREYARNHSGWKWDAAWDKFHDFLIDMGPKPAPHYELERTTTSIKTYGPVLCIWLDDTGQNNNKSDNIKVVDPATGQTLTSHFLAKKHGWALKTLYNRKAEG
jgi:hypothetical protein